MKGYKAFTLVQPRRYGPPVIVLAPSAATVQLVLRDPAWASHFQLVERLEPASVEQMEWSRRNGYLYAFDSHGVALSIDGWSIKDFLIGLLEDARDEAAILKARLDGFAQAIERGELIYVKDGMRASSHVPEVADAETGRMIVNEIRALLASETVAED